MKYGQLLSLLGLATILTLGNGWSGTPASGTEMPTGTGNAETPTCASGVPLNELRSERIDLSYYRNAKQIVDLVNALLPNRNLGCAQELLSNDVSSTDNLSVGQGGGNVILLYGKQDYIDRAYRLIAPLDLRLPGVDLQLWGAQISSERPDRLSEVMTDVRGEISLTQQLVRETFELMQREAKRTLAQQNLPEAYIREGRQPRSLPPLDRDFLAVATDLGYGAALSSARRFSLLDIILIGKAVSNTELYYNNLYSTVVDGTIIDGRFRAADERYQPYFDAMIKAGRPPFERFFRSLGLKPDCAAHNPTDRNCEMWTWIVVSSSTGNGGLSSVERIVNADRQTTLEFAFQFADYISNPNLFDPAELQRTADNLNSELQQITNALQRDIEDLFVRPTLINIQNRVSQTRGVTFAQVGRTTISTLSGVKTTVNSSSQSVFEISQSQDLATILGRADAIQQAVEPFIPKSTTEATEATEGDTNGTEETGNEEEIVSAGPLPVSRLIALITALAEQNSDAFKVPTGTNLIFTPGVLRDLNSAELNINLSITDPAFTPTQQNVQGENPVANISRIGIHTVNTTVYTQALDFFDLSTFTSQATLDGGRSFFPVVGQLWQAIFGSVPVFGDLFSFPRGPQTVLHESLLLTNSFITPTALGLGLLYPITDPTIYQGANFCDRQHALFEYLADLNSQGRDRRISRPISRERCPQ